MTDDQIALARRAVACKGWRWMPGMLRLSPVMKRRALRIGLWATFEKAEDIVRGYAEHRLRDRIVDHEGPWLEADRVWCETSEEWVRLVPDLTDPATLGCLLALVREAWGDPRLACVPWRLKWAVDRVWERNGRLSVAHTEAEALVAALEAAP